jgi:hypothetical protein
MSIPLRPRSRARTVGVLAALALTTAIAAGSPAVEPEVTADSSDYALHLSAAPPSTFPYFGHVMRAWQHRASDSPNGRPRSEAVVATLGYAIRASYENLVGRVTEAMTDYPSTAEDRLAASVAQEYAEFIRTRPWYEFDFTDRLGRVWDASWWDDDLVRKWERKYALTTEYAAKAFAAWIVRGIDDDTDAVTIPVAARDRR